MLVPTRLPIIILVLSSVTMAQDSSNLLQTRENPVRIYPLRFYPKYELLGGMGGNGYNAKSVTDELDLTPTQKGQLDKIAHELDRKREDIGASVQGEQVDPATINERRRQRKLAQIEFMQTSEPEFLKVLNNHQRTRLGQLQIQLEGPLAFLREEFQLRLNMSPGQIELINQLIEQGYAISSAELSRLRDTLIAIRLRDKAKSKQPAGGPPASPSPSLKKAQQPVVKKGMEANSELRGSLMREIFKHLTKVQRENYKKLIGKPFLENGRVIPKPRVVDSE